MAKEQSRFIKAGAEVRHRIIAASYGEVGTGKTTWWLGAPGPIFIQSFDKGLEGVVEEIAKEKEIRVAEYELMNPDGTELDQERGIEVRDQFIDDYLYALKNARTIVWDKESDVYDVFKYAEQGSVYGDSGTKPLDWDKLHSRIRRLINMAKATDVNLGLIQGMKNEWNKGGTNQNTGKRGIVRTDGRVRKGMQDVDALVHINIEHVRVPGGDGEASKFLINVGKSRGPGSRDVQDQQFEGLTFAEFAQLVFPESSAEEWA